MTLRWPAWVDTSDLSVIPDDPDVDVPLQGPVSADLLVPRTQGALAQLDLHGLPGVTAVRPFGAAGRQVLERLAAAPGPAPVIAVKRIEGRAVTAGSDARVIDLTIYDVPNTRTLDDRLRIGVDDKVAEQITRRFGGADIKAVDWLTNTFITPLGEDAGLVLASHGDPDAELRGGLQLHSRDARLEIAIGDDRGFRVARVTSIARPDPRLRETLQCMRGDIAFSDETYATRVEFLRSQLLADADNGASAVPASRYLEVWNAYEEENVRRLLRHARRFGVVRFVGADQRSAERWELTLGQPLDVERIRALPETADRFSVYAQRPFWLDQELTTSVREEVLRRERSLAEVRVMALDEDRVTVDVTHGRELPVAGVFVVSLAGEMAQVKRRLEVQDQLLRHADLQLILADKQVELPGTKRRRLPSKLPIGVLRAFGNREPNASQRRALEMAYESGGLVAIQGPPGTGKTSVVAALEHLYAADAGFSTTRGVVLVSAVQHDAVENVLAKSTVNGLPPIKHGTRSGEEKRADTRIMDWTRARAGAVDQRLSEIEGGDLARTVLRLMERARDYLGAAQDARATSALLRGLTAGAALDGARLLSAPLRDEIDDVASELDLASERTAAEIRRRDQRLRAAAELLRTESEAFEDDGPQAAERARIQLAVAGWTDGDDLGVVDGAAAGAPDFQALIALRDALLDEVAASSSLARRAVRHGRATELVRETLKELEAHLAKTPAARARALLSYRDALLSDPAAVQETLAQYLTVIGATTQQSGSVDRLFDDENVEFRLVVVDEAARAQPLDLLIPLVRSQECKVIVGDHRQLPQLVDDELVGAVSTTKGMSTEDLLQRSMFERFFQSLDRSRRAVTLREQYRMHPEIGNFVAEQFYPPRERFTTPPGIEPLRRHGITLPGYAGQTMRWLDVPHGRETRIDKSYSRESEAAAVVDELARLMEHRASLSFGLIAMYGAQVNQCWRELEKRGIAHKVERRWEVASDYRYCLDDDGREVRDEHGLAVRLRVGTVDSFQGREFDVVFVSLVRSSRAEDIRQRLGFTVTPNRLNVAMSRAKRLLVVAGDWRTFDIDTPATQPLREFYRRCTEP